MKKTAERKSVSGVGTGRRGGTSGGSVAAERGRAPARSARGIRRKGFEVGDLSLTALLLVLPGIALAQLCQHYPWVIVLGVVACVWVVTFIMIRGDKKCAEQQEWRTPESTLHLMELAGGWPASYLAQRIYWHKVSKVSYQVVFWLIVTLYQLVSVDYLLHWPGVKAIARWIELTIG